MTFYCYIILFVKENFDVLGIKIIINRFNHFDCSTVSPSDNSLGFFNINIFTNRNGRKSLCYEPKFRSGPFPALARNIKLKTDKRIKSHIFFIAYEHFWQFHVYTVHTFPKRIPKRWLFRVNRVQDGRWLVYYGNRFVFSVPDIVCVPFDSTRRIVCCSSGSSKLEENAMFYGTRGVHDTVAHLQALVQDVTLRGQKSHITRPGRDQQN